MVSHGRPSSSPALIGLVSLAALLLPARSLAEEPSAFVAFESGPVRPLALSPDGRRLFAVNTPDGQLEIFDVSSGRLLHQGSVPVGLEPVAVAARAGGEVWVVNHVSDSVSIVDASATPPRVVRTLLVGDEPNDVVFAGPDRARAFITTAHRGQHGPFPRSQYDVPGVGRADVWVFDADDTGSEAGGTPIRVLTLFGDKPRALATSPDGSRVYAGIFHSGNETTIVSVAFTCPGGAAVGPCSFNGVDAPGGTPGPNENHAGVAAKATSLIVRFRPEAGVGGEWQDELGRNWNDAVRFTLPDLDVFEIDALADPPVEVAAHAHVGTELFNMAVNPVSGKVYVSNTEARNEIRFEGPGIFAAAFKPPGVPATVRGHLHEARITVIDADGVQPRHLNKHIPYDVMPVPEGIAERSLATPLGMAVTRDGSTLYVAAFGSSRIGVFDTAELENDTFVPDAADHIEVGGGGPSGIALDEARERLYVATRFDNAVVAVDTISRSEVHRIPLHNPEPASLVEGRPFLYDARTTSSNGEASCSACHVFGDFDALAWDLGDPDGDVTPNPNPLLPLAVATDFHPMKGPMTTQSLRGLAGHGPMHWRGDRTGGLANPPVDPLDERAAFEQFNVAFDGLIGRDEGPLTDAQMRAFAEFALQIEYPPNPIRRLDNTLRPDEELGRAKYFDHRLGHQSTCNGCHALDPLNGFYGTSGLTALGARKVPHLRNLYQKIGMFGFPELALIFLDGTGFTGPQIRGFGFRKSGDFDTVLRFLSQVTFAGIFDSRSEIEAFLMSFPSKFAPIVGQQMTLAGAGAERVHAFLDLLEARAAAPFVLPGVPDTRECDLVVRGVVEGEPRGWLRRPDGTFRSDRASEDARTGAALRRLSAADGNELTWTCAPPGTGIRLAIDRDSDGSLDGDERDAGTNPANAGSVVGACSDGVDNDGDGAVDHPGDPGCASAASNVENPACDDGIDGDGDGLTDFPEDPSCLSASGEGEGAVVRVDIDIQPFDPRNRVRSRSGIVAVALLGSEAFDAADADASSLEFGPDEAGVYFEWPGFFWFGRHFLDVDRDGFADRVFVFRAKETGLALGDEQACLTGSTLTGDELVACDAVEVVPPPRWLAWWSDWRLARGARP